MKITDLTLSDFEQLDPTGSARTWITQLQSHSETKPGSPSPYFRFSPEEMLERYWKLMSGITCNPAYETFNKSQAKAYAPQGGHIAYHTLEAILSEYFDEANSASRPIHDVLIRGRNYLLSLVASLMRKVGGPTYVKSMGPTGTHGGLPTCAQKGTWDAETVGMKPWRHLFPALPGTRFMRNKPRAIFMDSTANVRIVESILAAVKRWLITYLPDLFSTWMNPHFARNAIVHKALVQRFASVEGDYKGMDIRFRRQIAEELILPLYEVLLPDCYLTMATYVHETFEQPLFMGNVLWEGEHTLFSGVSITNDFETIYTVMLLLGAMLTLDIRKGYILALGDDMTALVPPDRAEELMRLIIEASDSTGLIIHPLGSKSNIHTDHVEFCRECFTLGNYKLPNGVIVGQYPSVLTLNSIVQPEKPRKGTAQEFSAVLQCCDNISWNTEFVPFAQMVRKYTTFDWNAAPSEVPVTWWERVYGERWNPATSPTWASLQANKLVRPEVAYRDFRPTFVFELG